LLHDAHAVSPYEAAVHASLADRSERMLSCLAPREATVLRLRFGLGGEHEHTLEEIGTRFLLTRERIRQVEAKALALLPESPSRETREAPYGASRGGVGLMAERAAR
jgi:RNA polymerase primary sigma factor